MLSYGRMLTPIIISVLASQINKNQNVNLVKLLILNISLQQIEDTEEHVKQYHGDSISKI